MEIGTDPNELFADMSHKKIEIVYNDRIWEFKIRDITWSEKNQIISSSTNITGKKGNTKAKFDVNVYNQLYLEKSVVNAPFEMNKMNILKLSDRFGDLLIDAVVDRLDKVEAEEEKN